MNSEYFGGGELIPYFDGGEGLDTELAGARNALAVRNVLAENVRSQIGRFGDVGGLEPGDVKKAFDAIPAGIQGRPNSPPTDIASLMAWYKRSELVYACIRKIAQAAIDPRLIVERRRGDTWEAIPGHPLTMLIQRPNPMDDAASFIGAQLVSENVAGKFVAEKVYDSDGNLAQLWPLNPSKIRPIPGRGPDGSPVEGYEWRDGADRQTFRPKELLIRTNRDLTNRFHGLAPLAVCLGSVDADRAQTDYIRAFFNNSGVPSGILTFKNRKLNRGEMEQKRQAWMMRYGRGGSGERGIAVLDESAEYNRIGITMSEMESEFLTGRDETRICMVFGVPPLLVGAYVGLLHVNQRASARESQADFWTNTMSPEFALLRSFYTWNLLPEFEDIEAIKREEIRVGWDMSKVIALQEGEAERKKGEKDHFQAGGITHNEYREAIGRKPYNGGDFFLIPQSMNPRTGEVLIGIARELPAEPAPPAEEAPQDDPPADDAPKDGLPDFDALALKADALAAPPADKRYTVGDLVLSRKPKGVELTLDLKAILAAPKGPAQAIRGALLALRKRLNAQAADALAKADPGGAHELILTPDGKIYETVRAQLEKAYKKGRALILAERAAQQAAKAGLSLAVTLNNDPETKGVEDEDDEFLDQVTDATVSRVVNDVQSKAAALFATLAVLRVAADQRRARLEETLGTGSPAFIEQASSAVAHAAMSAGRDAEIEAQGDGVKRVLYSAILDKDVCEQCEPLDGQEAASVDDLPSAPNEFCLGGDKCRCLHVAVFE